jgi:hypothetical protein
MFPVMKQDLRDHVFEIDDDFETAVKWLLKACNIDFYGWRTEKLNSMMFVDISLSTKTLWRNSFSLQNRQSV